MRVQRRANGSIEIADQEGTMLVTFSGRGADIFRERMPGRLRQYHRCILRRDGFIELGPRVEQGLDW